MNRYVLYERSGWSLSDRLVAEDENPLELQNHWKMRQADEPPFTPGSQPRFLFREKYQLIRVYFVDFTYTEVTLPETGSVGDLKRRVLRKVHLTEDPTQFSLYEVRGGAEAKLDESAKVTGTMARWAIDASSSDGKGMSGKNPGPANNPSMAASPSTAADRFVLANENEPIRSVLAMTRGASGSASAKGARGGRLGSKFGITPELTRVYFADESFRSFSILPTTSAEQLAKLVGAKLGVDPGALSGFGLFVKIGKSPASMMLEPSEYPARARIEWEATRKEKKKAIDANEFRIYFLPKDVSGAPKPATSDTVVRSRTPTRARTPTRSRIASLFGRKQPDERIIKQSVPTAAGVSSVLTQADLEAQPWKNNQVLQGILTKQTSRTLSWRARFFILTKAYLFYFDKETDEFPLGVINLLGCSVATGGPPSPPKGLSHFFSITTPGRVYYIAAESEKQAASWVRSIEPQCKVSAKPTPAPVMPAPSHAGTSTGGISLASEPTPYVPPVSKESRVRQAMVTNLTNHPTLSATELRDILVPTGPKPAFAAHNVDDTSSLGSASTLDSDNLSSPDKSLSGPAAPAPPGGAARSRPASIVMPPPKLVPEYKSGASIRSSRSFSSTPTSSSRSTVSKKSISSTMPAPSIGGRRQFTTPAKNRAPIVARASDAVEDKYFSQNNASAKKRAEAAESIQRKAFTSWVNIHLRQRAMYINNLQTDFSDGVLLINLLEILTGKNFIKYHRSPRMLAQAIDNFTLAFGYARKNRVQTPPGISAEDIVDGNMSVILRLLWALIVRFELPDLGHALTPRKLRELLIVWSTANLPETWKKANPRGISNFHSDWSDGTAFAGLMHAQFPDAFEWELISPKEPVRNMEFAFNAGLQFMGIPVLFDPSDLRNNEQDELAIITYLLLCRRAFRPVDASTATSAVNAVVATVTSASPKEAPKEAPAPVPVPAGSARPVGLGSMKRSPSYSSLVGVSGIAKASSSMKPAAVPTPAVPEPEPAPPSPEVSNRKSAGDGEAKKDDKPADVPEVSDSAPPAKPGSSRRKSSGSGRRRSSGGSKRRRSSAGSRRRSSGNRGPPPKLPPRPGRASDAAEEVGLLNRRLNDPSGQKAWVEHVGTLPGVEPRKPRSETGLSSAKKEKLKDIWSNPRLAANMNSWRGAPDVEDIQDFLQFGGGEVEEDELDAMLNFYSDLGWTQGSPPS